MCDDSELAARLEKYLSTAVLRKLREDVPLELCSELRPVTSLFVQLKFADRINAIELSSSLGDCSNTISGIISPHKGEINKTLLFDKGCTFLCVFGFPGEKLAHEITTRLGMRYADLPHDLHGPEKTPEGGGVSEVDRLAHGSQAQSPQVPPASHRVGASPHQGMELLSSSGQEQGLGPVPRPPVAAIPWL
ncbi:adenylate cyclase type 10-like [Gallus gallus]|uniref:adenylate cyclase type 10-like n=1 Tax=Gallus gallus TaxID=9031 RepID=UPI001AEA8941|nr:adenylate cyclase type 10-like [Gallus gallus]